MTLCINAIEGDMGAINGINSIMHVSQTMHDSTTDRYASEVMHQWELKFSILETILFPMYIYLDNIHFCMLYFSIFILIFKSSIVVKLFNYFVLPYHIDLIPAYNRYPSNTDSCDIR